jgi:hypothetical protein
MSSSGGIFWLIKTSRNIPQFEKLRKTGGISLTYIGHPGGTTMFTVITILTTLASTPYIRV